MRRGSTGRRRPSEQSQPVGRPPASLRSCRRRRPSVNPCPPLSSSRVSAAVRISSRPLHHIGDQPIAQECLHQSPAIDIDPTHVLLSQLLNRLLWCAAGEPNLALQRLGHRRIGQLFQPSRLMAMKTCVVIIGRSSRRIRDHGRWTVASRRAMRLSRKSRSATTSCADARGCMSPRDHGDRSRRNRGVASERRQRSREAGLVLRIVRAACRARRGRARRHGIGDSSRSRRLVGRT